MTTCSPCSPCASLRRRANHRSVSIVDTPTSVNGAKELKYYIKEITEILTNIRSEFETDLAGKGTSFIPIRICREEYDLRCKRCAVEHRNFVHTITSVPKYSIFLQAEAAALDCLAQMELVRKMMVTNKQQKKTTVRNLRRIIARESKASLLLPALSLDKEMDTVSRHLQMIAANKEAPLVTELKAMVTITKQNHRTVAQNLLKQAGTLMTTMRYNHILAYKAAAETTIGEIMNHASACHAFMRQTLHLAVIEYCASRWFHSSSSAASEGDGDVESVTAELVSGLDRTFDMSRSGSYFSFLAENRPIPEIIIMVWGDSEYRTIEFDQTFAETIITDEAIAAFEQEQATLI